MDSEVSTEVAGPLESTAAGAFCPDPGAGREDTSASLGAVPEELDEEGLEVWWVGSSGVCVGVADPVEDWANKETANADSPIGRPIIQKLERTARIHCMDTLCGKQLQFCICRGQGQTRVFADILSMTVTAIGALQPGLILRRL